MSKFLDPQPKLGLIKTGPKRHDKMMFGGPLEAPMPGRKIWKIGDILDQKSEGACVGFGWTGFLLSEPNPFNLDKSEQFSFPLSVYRRAQQLDDFPGEEPEYYGTTVEAGHAALLEKGLVSETMWWATSLGQLTKHLSEYGPVVVGTDWTNKMFTPNKLGYVKVTGNPSGGHCYLLYGFDSVKEDFYFVNSWGIDWGIEGKFKMKYSEFNKLLKSRGYGISTLDLS